MPTIEETCLQIPAKGNESSREVMEAVRQAFVNLIDHDAIEFPVHVTVLARNGSGQIYRWASRPNGVDLDVTTLAEYAEDFGMRFPIHALVMDSNGRTLRVIVTKQSKGSHLALAFSSSSRHRHS